MQHLTLSAQHRHQAEDGPPVPAGLPSYLAPFVTEAKQSTRFAALWLSDDASRAYAAACLALAPLARMPLHDRLGLYESIAARPRRAVLSEAVGTDLPPFSLGIIARCVYPEFTANDWRSLICMIADGARTPLAHVPRISARLVRQLPSIPFSLWHPGLLVVADRHLIPETHWRQLSDALDRAGPERRAPLNQCGARVRSLAQFYDLLRAANDAVRDAAPFPPAPDLGPQFRQLTNARAMRREGFAMRNCLADLVDEAASGEWAYYAFLGVVPATVGLRRSGSHWRFARNAGVANAALPEETERAISARVVRALGPAATATGMAPPAIGEGRLAVIAEVARAEFTSEERTRVARAVRSIRGRSRRGGDGAFTILDVGPFYVQCLSEVDSPEYRVEIASHRTVPAVEPLIDETVVALLEAARFRWPRKGGNFARSMAVHDEEDCVVLADLLLGLLHALFGHRSGGRLTVNTHVP